MGAQPAEAAIGTWLPPGAHWSRGRALTKAERQLAAQVFGRSLDLSAVRITRDSPLALGSATSVCNRINLRSDQGHFDGPELKLARGQDGLLVHELLHCWQWQHGGVAYMADSIWAQAVGMVRGRGRSYAYDWRRAAKARRPWHRFNPEQQAQCVEDWWVARQSGFAISPLQEAAVAALRRGQGAPRVSPLGVVLGSVLGAVLGAIPGALLGLLWGLGGALSGAIFVAVCGAYALGVARPFRRR